MVPRYRPGATLIEVLVVIGVVAGLVALVFPAVQAAREAARRTECQNRLHQLSLAALLHEQAQRQLPTGGWGWGWQPDPDRGFDRRQPGGWPFALLPFLEQAELREAGSGQADPLKRAAVRQMAETSLPVFHCPSRRAAVPYPFVTRDAFFNIDRPAMLARSDYSGNVGSIEPGLYGPGPATLAEGDRPNFRWRQLDRNGVIFRRNEVRLSDVLDGQRGTCATQTLCG